MQTAKRRVIEASLLFLAIFAPVLFIGASKITKPTFFFAWDAPRALWECWVLAGLGMIATLTEIFIPRRQGALKATIGLLVSIISAGMLYFLYQSTQSYADEVLRAIKGQAFFAGIFGSGGNIDDTLNRIASVRTISYSNVSAYIWTFVLAGYGGRALVEFIGEAKAAIARQG